MHTRDVHACKTAAHEMHTREMYTREIYAHRNVAFLGGYGGAVFTLVSDDHVDSLHQTQRAPLILTTDRMQPFNLVVCGFWWSLA